MNIEHAIPSVVLADPATQPSSYFVRPDTFIATMASLQETLT